MAGENEEVPQAGAAVAAPPEGGGAGAGAPAGGEGGEGGSTQVNGWEAQPIPDGMREQYQGVNTFGELHQRYQESSRESRANRELLTTLQRQYLDQLSDFSQGRRQQQAQPQQQAAPAGFHSFKDRAEFEAFYKADPMGAVERMQTAIAQRAVEQYTKQNLTPQIQQAQQQTQMLERRAYEQYVGSTWNDFAKEFPDFVPGKPMHTALTRAFENDPELLRFAQSGQNFPKVLRWVAGSLQGQVAQQQAKAAEGKLAETRGKSGAARVGAGGAGAPRKGSIAETIRMRAEEARKKGETVSEADIQARIDQAASLGMK